MDASFTGRSSVVQTRLCSPRELITLKPTEVDPLFRYAQYQGQQGAIEGAEETLLALRRVQPNVVEPFKMLARFYARRASALHASEMILDEAAVLRR
jgi:hypothetical protein